VPLTLIAMWGYRCLRCGWEWEPKGLEREPDGQKPEDPWPEPANCPRCTTPDWNVPRKNNMSKPRKQNYRSPLLNPLNRLRYFK
jgi:hypothetical protein